MKIRSDFEIIYFGEHLGDKDSDISALAAFVGNQTTVKSFTINGVPTQDAYILLQVYDINSKGHKILVNGTDLGGWDIPPRPQQWQLWMDIIDTDNLVQGENTVQIVRDPSSKDNFLIEHAVIHWKESV